MGAFRIIKTNPKKADFSLFSEVLSNVYSGQFLEIKKRNDIPVRYLKSCLVLMNDEKPLARLAIYLNPFFENTFLLGGYECVDDYEISLVILEAGLKEILQLNKSRLSPTKGIRIIGPMNGSTWEDYRFSESNDNPFFLEPIQPEYYINQWQLFGFQRFVDYRSDFRSSIEIDFGKMKKWENYFEKKGIQIRPFDKNNTKSFFQKLAKFNMEAFKENFLFSPIPEVDFIEKYQKLVPFINPNLVHLAWENEEIVGMVFCIPNLFSQENNETLVLKTLAVKQGFRYRGLGDLLYMKCMEGGLEIGAKNVIHALMKNDNVSVNISKNKNAECFREYGLYEFIVK